MKVFRKLTKRGQNLAKRSGSRVRAEPQSLDELAAAASKLKISEDDVVIAVMGITGTGKSSFIKLLTHFGVEVGHDLQSCTYDIGIHSFQLNGRSIFLIDTPGFDDTHRSDTQILKDIAYFLSAAYAKKVKLAGIIYLHRITDIRMTGTAAKNLSMFQLLCGTDSMSNVVLASTRWDDLKNEEGRERGKANEKQLKNTYWKPMLQDGSKMFRHDNTALSALNIVNYIMGLKQPAVLDIQRQIVDEKRTLDDTPVGQEVQRELFEQKRRHEGELRDLQAGLDKAIQQGKQELAETLAKLEEDKKEQMKAASEQEKALRADFDRLQRENEAKYAETINKLEEEKKAMQVEEEKRRKDLEGIGKQSESLNKTVDSLVAMRQKSEQEWQRQIGYLEKSALNEARWIYH